MGFESTNEQIINDVFLELKQLIGTDLQKAKSKHCLQAITYLNNYYWLPDEHSKLAISIASLSLHILVKHYPEAILLLDTLYFPTFDTSKFDEIIQDINTPNNQMKYLIEASIYGKVLDNICDESLKFKLCQKGIIAIDKVLSSTHESSKLKLLELFYKFTSYERYKSVLINRLDDSHSFYCWHLFDLIEASYNNNDILIFDNYSTKLKEIIDNRKYTSLGASRSHLFYIMMGQKALREGKTTESLTFLSKSQSTNVDYDLKSGGFDLKLVEKLIDISCDFNSVIKYVKYIQNNLIEDELSESYYTNFMSLCSKLEIEK